MSIVCLLALSIVGQTPIGDPPSLRSQRAVEIKPEPVKLDEKGREIVTIRVKIKPDYYLYATPQPDELFMSSEMKLTVRSRDPRTRVDVTYPKGRTLQVRDFHWAEYEGEIAVVAVVHRAKGDDSPLECTLRFHPMQRGV